MSFHDFRTGSKKYEDGEKNEPILSLETYIEN